MAKEIEDNAVVKRHLDFPGNIYKDAWKLMDEENARPGSVREYMKTFLVKLMGDGVAFRRGEVFSRAQPGKLARNKDWIRLKAAAKMAVQEFQELEDKLLNK